MASLADKLIRSSFLRVLNLVANIVVAFFMMPFVIGSIGDRWYGLWIIVGTLVGYYGFFDLGLSSALQRFVSRTIGTEDYEEMNSIFNTSFVLFLGAGALAIVITLVIIIGCPLFMDNATDISIFRIVIALIGFNMAISLPLRAFEGFLYAQVRYDVVNIILVIKLLIRTLLIVLFLKAGYGIISLAIITLSVDILGYLASIVFVVKKYQYLTISVRSFCRDRIKILFSYSIFSFITHVATKLRFQVSSFIITAFLGLSLVTHFNIGSRIALYYMMIITSAIALMMPVFSRFEGLNDYNQIRKNFLFVSKLNFILSLFIGGSILIYGRAFIVRWMGPDYLDSFHVLIILITGLIFHTMQMTSVTLIFGLSKHKPYSFIVLAEGAANIALSILLVRRYGIVGVALGVAIPMLITSIFIVPIYACRIIALRLRDYVLLAIKGLLIGAIVLFAMWLAIRGYITESFIRIFTLGAITSIIFLIVNIFVMLNREERRKIKIPI